jgi:hypothetical protein
MSHGTWGAKVRSYPRGCQQAKAAGHEDKPRSECQNPRDPALQCYATREVASLGALTHRTLGVANDGPGIRRREQSSHRCGAFDYEPDAVMAYDVGPKNRFLDDRLQVSAAVTQDRIIVSGASGQLGQLGCKSVNRARHSAAKSRDSRD